MIPVRLIMRIPSTTTDLQVVQFIYDRTGGEYGNLDAVAEGEKLDNCIPAAAGGGLVVGDSRYYCIIISHWYLQNWPWGDYGGLAEIMPYNPWKDIIDEDGTTHQIPNTEPYLCGHITDSDGVAHQVMMGL